jgi:hypothetical protein
MSTEKSSTPDYLPHSFKNLQEPLVLWIEAAEANRWHDAIAPIVGRNIEIAGRNICLEVASTEVTAGSAALPVTIPKTEPPRVAELLVCCLGGPKKRYRRALFDDFDEDFQCDLSKGMTVDRARRRYWGRALRSIGPQLWALAKQIGIFGLIADYARRLW